MSDELNKIFENDQKKYRVLQSVYNLSNPDKFVGVSAKQVADFTQIPMSEAKEILNRLCDFDELIDCPTNTSGFMSNHKTIDKIKQYKKLEIEEILREFRQIASDLIHMNSYDEMSYLKRFINFIESKPIIFDFIQDNNRVRQFEIERVIDSCVQLVHTYVQIPKGKNEEIAFTYQLLKYGLEKFNAYYVFTIQIPAYGSREEGVLKFNKTIVSYFCNHIDHYLTTMLNKLGADEQSYLNSTTQNLNFNGNVGAVQTGNHNIAHVTQNNYSSQSLVDAAKEIQELLENLAQIYPTNTLSDKMVVVTKAVEQIENNRSLKERTVGALKSAGVEGFKELIDNPLINILMAAIEGWKEGK
ncbi:MAG: hypothetical protein DCF19_11075 [Pseudanabaena frigida]|uniref:Uncharacterized protein n=1 Tax=Pseudanabaena frigida TaxID=945775 RepID=A0A2W4W6T6_9CYAN|nr:MAG: hypothetical protein DCF19_11075 [Pseudanabaena frigida]